VAEVDLAALRKNVDVIASAVGPRVGILAVVKADAYGHGALACARALERKVWGFAVSLVEEGVELRRGGIEAPIIVLGSFYGYAHRDVVAYRLTPVVSDEADLDKFARAAEELAGGPPPRDSAAGPVGPRVGVHLKIDTGMSRLGVRPERLDEMLARLRAAAGVELTGLCTHFADADRADPARTEAQLATFDEARRRVLAAGLHPTLTHAANSAATVRFAASRFDLVRPGLALYGHNPSAHAAFAGLTPALALKSRIVAVRDVPAGTRVSYGGLAELDAPGRIATVPVGYADGLPRGDGHVLVGGRRRPILGAVTMDMVMVGLPPGEGRVGDEVVLIGGQQGERIDAEEVAARSGRIVWELFTGISKRVPRVYVGERY
jgi:alanine racemase